MHNVKIKISRKIPVKVLRNVFAYACWLVLAGSSLLQAQSLVATVNPRQPAANQAFQVAFQLEGAQARSIESPDFGQLQVVGGPSTFQNTQIVNGQVSQSITYTYRVLAEKPGTYTIGKASVEAGGKKYSSEPVQVKVVAGNPGNAGDDGKASADIMKQIKENVFVRAIVTKRKVYQGEQFMITYKLYTRLGFKSLDVSDSPTFQDFWKEELDPKSIQFVRENYKGQPFNVAEIKRAILFPQKSGKLEIKPLKLEGVVQIRTQTRRRPRSIFDDFFGNAMGIQEVPYTFSSGKVTIDSRPLPSQGRPAGFNGAVGDYKLDVSLDKEELETGDAATFSIKVSGRGNIKTVELPQLDFPPDFEVYDPKIDDRVSRATNMISGTKTFDYLIVPRNPGTYKLPAVDFAYFDPKKKRYYSLNSDEYELKARGEAIQSSAINSALIKKEDVELIGQDIHYIQTETGSLKERGASFLATGGFAALYLLPFFAFAALLWMRIRQDKMASDVAGTRSRKATQLAKKRLKVAREHLGKKEEKPFYDEVVRTVWGFLSDKLNIGQSELSRDNIREKLLKREVPSTLIDQTTALLDTCEMALFAPSAAPGGMQGTYEGALSLISELENTMQKAS